MAGITPDSTGGGERLDPIEAQVNAEFSNVLDGVTNYFVQGGMDEYPFTIINEEGAFPCRVAQEFSHEELQRENPTPNYTIIQYESGRTEFLFYREIEDKATGRKERVFSYANVTPDGKIMSCMKSITIDPGSMGVVPGIALDVDYDNAQILFNFNLDEPDNQHAILLSEQESLPEKLGRIRVLSGLLRKHHILQKGELEVEPLADWRKMVQASMNRRGVIEAMDGVFGGDANNGQDEAINGAFEVVSAAVDFKAQIDRLILLLEKDDFDSHAIIDGVSHVIKEIRIGGVDNSEDSLVRANNLLIAQKPDGSYLFVLHAATFIQQVAKYRFMAAEVDPQNKVGVSIATDTFPLSFFVEVSGILPSLELDDGEPAIINYHGYEPEQSYTDVGSIEVPRNPELITVALKEMTRVMEGLDT